jgi:hypothetical protein
MTHNLAQLERLFPNYRTCPRAQLVALFEQEAIRELDVTHELIMRDSGNKPCNCPAQHVCTWVDPRKRKKGA